MPYWSNPPILIFDIRTLALRTERQSVRMSKIKNGGLAQYGAEHFEQQQFGTAGVEGANKLTNCTFNYQPFKFTLNANTAKLNVKVASSESKHCYAHTSTKTTKRTRSKRVLYFLIRTIKYRTCSFEL